MGLYQRRGPTFEEVWAPRALTIEGLVQELPDGAVQVVGDGWKAFENFWPEDFKARANPPSAQWPEARDLFPMMVEGSTLRQNLPWETVKPLYIRASEAEEKLRRGILKPQQKV